MGYALTRAFRRSSGSPAFAGKQSACTSVPRGNGISGGTECHRQCGRRHKRGWGSSAVMPRAMRFVSTRVALSGGRGVGFGDSVLGHWRSGACRHALRAPRVIGARARTNELILQDAWRVRLWHGALGHVEEDGLILVRPALCSARGDGSA